MSTLSSSSATSSSSQNSSADEVDTSSSKKQQQNTQTKKAPPPPCRRWRKPWSRRRSSSVETAPCSFPQFTTLSDDLQLHILQFVATAPYEILPQRTIVQQDGSTSSNNDTRQKPTLTMVFPRVSRSFGRMARSSRLWEAALQRAMQRNAVWKSAVANATHGSNSTNNSIQRTSPSLLGPGAVAVLTVPNDDFQTFYQHTAQTHIQFTGPVFLMSFSPGDTNNTVALPVDYDLYFFERRYRLMMQQLLSPLQTLETAHETLAATANNDNSVIDNQAISFLHAYQSLDSHQPAALLVQVRRCWMHRDGSYSVSLHCVAHTYLERVWVQPESGGLVYATAVRVRDMTTA